MEIGLDEAAYISKNLPIILQALVVLSRILETVLSAIPNQSVSCGNDIRELLENFSLLVCKYLQDNASDVCHMSSNAPQLNLLFTYLSNCVFGATNKLEVTDLNKTMSRMQEALGKVMELSESKQSFLENVASNDGCLSKANSFNNDKQCLNNGSDLTEICFNDDSPCWTVPLNSSSDEPPMAIQGCFVNLSLESAYSTDNMVIETPAASPDCSPRGSPQRVVESKHVVKTASDDGFKQINGYVVLRNIARGSYGKVKLVLDSISGSTRALKIIPKSLLKKVPGYSEQVRGEIALMKKLRHPNIVSLFEVIDDEEAGRLYLVLEYMDSGPIAQVANDGTLIKGVIEESIVIKYAKDAMNGLLYLHRHNVIHRDIKPENLLLDRHGVCKLADFGVSRLGVSGSTGDLTSDFQGTPSFLAPECYMFALESVHGKPVDVWALGVTLLTLLLGRIPFKGISLAELGNIISTNEAPLPPNARLELTDFFSRVLEKDPERRIALVGMITHPFITGESLSKTFVSEDEMSQAIKKVSNVRIPDFFSLVVKLKIRTARLRRRSMPEKFDMKDPDENDEEELQALTPIHSSPNLTNTSKELNSEITDCFSPVDSSDLHFDLPQKPHPPPFISNPHISRLRQRCLLPLRVSPIRRRTSPDCFSPINAVESPVPPSPPSITSSQSLPLSSYLPSPPSTTRRSTPSPSNRSGVPSPPSQIKPKKFTVELDNSRHRGSPPPIMSIPSPLKHLSPSHGSNSPLPPVVHVSPHIITRSTHSNRLSDDE